MSEPEREIVFARNCYGCGVRFQATPGMTRCSACRRILEIKGRDPSFATLERMIGAVEEAWRRDEAELDLLRSIAQAADQFAQHPIKIKSLGPGEWFVCLRDSIIGRNLETSLVHWKEATK